MIIERLDSPHAPSTVADRDAEPRKWTWLAVLVLTILLIVLAVTGHAGPTRTTDYREQYIVATADLAEGTLLTLTNTDVVTSITDDLSVGGRIGLAPADLEEGIFLWRPIRAGEPILPWHIDYYRSDVIPERPSYVERVAVSGEEWLWIGRAIKLTIIALIVLSIVKRSRVAWRELAAIPEPARYS